MPYAVVTGASKGIGFHISEKLAERGFDLLLVARSEQQLFEAGQQITKRFPVKVQHLAMDLSLPESPALLAKHIHDQHLQVSVLVNNAGFGVWGKFESTPLKQIVEMMEVNMSAMVKLTHLLLPEMEKQAPAYILNIASTAAYQAVPTLGCYAASKSFVVLFSRALDYELRSKNITVTCFSPGPTITNFNHRAGIDDPVVIKRSERFGMNAAEVAGMAVDALFKRKKEVVPGWMNKISSSLTSIAPKWMVERVAAGLYEK